MVSITKLKSIEKLHLDWNRNNDSDKNLKFDSDNDNGYKN